jgi:hypothetical protein
MDLLLKDYSPALPWPLELLLEWLPPSAKELPKPPRVV